MIGCNDGIEGSSGKAFQNLSDSKSYSVIFTKTKIERKR